MEMNITKWRTESTALAFHISAADANDGCRRAGEAGTRARAFAGGRAFRLAVHHLGDASIAVKDCYKFGFSDRVATQSVRTIDGF